MYGRKKQRFQYEDDFHSLSKKIANIEQQTDFLKKTMLRQAVELNECSCTSTEDLSFNNIQITSDSIDEGTGIAGCETPTLTDEHPVQISSTQYTTKPNNVTVKQDEHKNAGVVGNIEGARIIESNPISSSNTN
ncbi:hypothetical protein WA026_011348 [Henosepilachna vigintioctopunctata]|uniref:Uncharacterized protein n=1 Tax=Henosepilachna vigintioctopunctata TaxID=420089 RepID=A0AAW1TSL2_9CUCU